MRPATALRRGMRHGAECPAARMGRGPERTADRNGPPLPAAGGGMHSGRMARTGQGGPSRPGHPNPNPGLHRIMIFRLVVRRDTFWLDK